MSEDLEYKEKYFKYKNKYIEYKMKFSKFYQDKEQEQELVVKQINHDLSYSHILPIDMRYNSNYIKTDINHMIFGMGCEYDENFNNQPFFISKSEDNNNFNERFWCYMSTKSVINKIISSTVGFRPRLNINKVKRVITQIIIDLKYIKIVNDNNLLNLKVKIRGHSFGGLITNRIAEILNTPFLLKLKDYNKINLKTFYSNPFKNSNNEKDYDIIKDIIKDYLTDFTFKEYKDLLKNLILLTCGTIYVANKENVNNINIINYISKGDIAKLVAWHSGNAIMTDKIVLKNNFKKNITLLEFGGKYNNIIPICLYEYYNYQNNNVSFINDNNSSWYIGNLYNYDISSKKICDKKLKETISWTIHGSYYSFMQIIDFIYDNYNTYDINNLLINNTIKINDIFNYDNDNYEIRNFFFKKINHNILLHEIFNYENYKKNMISDMLINIKNINIIVKKLFQEINKKIELQHDNILDLDFEYVCDNINKFIYYENLNNENIKQTYIKNEKIEDVILGQIILDLYYVVYRENRKTNKKDNKPENKLNLREFLLFYFAKNIFDDINIGKFNKSLLFFFQTKNNDDESEIRYNQFKNILKEYDISLSKLMSFEYNLEIVPIDSEIKITNISKFKSIFNWHNTVL